MKKLAILGVSLEEKSIYRYVISKIEKDEIVGLYDNYKHGQVIDKFTIQSPLNLKEIDKESVFILITTGKKYESIKTQLEGYGFVQGINFEFAINMQEYVKNDEYKIYKASQIKNNVMYPSILHLELSTACDVRCVYCPFHSNLISPKIPLKFFDFDKVDELINKVNQLGTITSLVATGKGEIFLNKNWFEILQKICENTNINKLDFSTNGMLLNEENIEKINRLGFSRINVRISLDGNSPEENDFLRKGSNYEKVKNSVNILKSKSRDNISILIRSCYIPTIEQVELCRTEGRAELPVQKFLEQDFKGMDIVSYPVVCFDKLSKKIEENYPEWKSKEVANYQEDVCTNMFNMLCIGAGGEIVHCACGEAAEVEIGNIFSDYILKVWNGEVMTNARKQIRAGKMPEVCSGCPMNRGGKYKMITLAGSDDTHN